MEEKIPVSIVYLGKRGGGAKITAQILRDLNTSKSFLTISTGIRRDNELAKEYDQSKNVYLFNSLISFTTPMHLLKYFLAPRKLLEDLNLSSNGYCIVPMISPLGLVIEFLLKTQGITVIRLLHDFEKHPGEIWPPNFLIRYLVNHSSFLISLGNNVGDKIRNLNPSIKLAVYPHPPFDFLYSPIDFQPTHEYILFIGRIRKYKGVENLISGFVQLEIPGLNLVIAGEGKLPVFEHPRIKVINRWLAENEIASLVQNAEIVVFPYIEASQSGLLPYCVSENKKVVVTPLPGLLEQTIGYQNTYVTKDFSIDSLSHSLLSAMQSETYKAETETPISKNIETCLLESGLFIKK